MYGIRNLTHWNPWAELERIQTEFERGGVSPGSTLQSPAIDVWGDGDGLRLRALVPGVKPEDLEIGVEGDTLTIRGTIQGAGAPPEGRWIRRERAGGTFQRALQLPFTVDATHVTARLANGVLEMSLPRTAAEKPRRIPIQAT